MVYGLTSAVVVAMLIATPGLIVSSQIVFGIAGGTSPGTSNVGGNFIYPFHQLFVIDWFFNKVIGR